MTSFNTDAQIYSFTPAPLQFAKVRNKGLYIDLVVLDPVDQIVKQSPFLFNSVAEGQRVAESMRDPKVRAQVRQWPDLLE